MQGKVTRSADNVTFIGIDVSKGRLDVALAPAGVTFAVTNDKKGHKTLLKKLIGLDVGVIVLEATGKYHRGVHLFLHEKGLPVCVVNPYRSRKFADALGELAKTDKIDAKVLARYGEFIGPGAQIPVSKTLSELAEILNTRDSAIRARTALRNRLAAANSSLVLQLLAIGVFINSLAFVPFGMVQSAGRPDLTAKLHMLELPIYLLLLWFLLNTYGIVGAAIAWVVRAAIDTILLFVMSHRLLSAVSSLTMRSIFMIGIAFLVLAVAALISGVVIKGLFLLLVLFIFAVMVWFVILEPDEKNLICTRIKAVTS